MADTKLFQPLKLGALNLAHRVVMAPLTRYRAADDHSPLPFVKDYYRERVTVPGGLIIGEATLISPRASGHFNVPGIWSDAQVSAWREVVDAVHGAGGLMACQLWALGRAAETHVKEAEQTGPLESASDVALKDRSADEIAPNPLTKAEIKEYIAAYAQAARNARQAGFDAIEIHAANGYFLDQFLQDVSNHRADAYGGSVENRSRLVLEVVKAVIDAVGGADRVAVRFSPFSRYLDMRMEDPLPQFQYLLKELKGLGLAWLHLVEPRVSGSIDVDVTTESLKPLLDVWDGDSPVLIAGGLTPEKARELVGADLGKTEVAAVFGRSFVSNPDLVFRIQKGIPLAPFDRKTFYDPKNKDGYLGYTFSEEWTLQE